MSSALQPRATPFFMLCRHDFFVETKIPGEQIHLPRRNLHDGEQKIPIQHVRQRFRTGLCQLAARSQHRRQPLSVCAQHRRRVLKRRGSLIFRWCSRGYGNYSFQEFSVLSQSLGRVLERTPVLLDSVRYNLKIVSQLVRRKLQ